MRGFHYVLNYVVDEFDDWLPYEVSVIGEWFRKCGMAGVKSAVSERHL